MIELYEYFELNNNNNNNDGNNINNNNSKKQVLYVKCSTDGIFLQRQYVKPTTVTGLNVELSEPPELLPYVEIVGSKITKQLETQTTNLRVCKAKNNLNKQQQKNVYLYIYSYVKEIQPLRRTRRVQILCFHKSTDLEENMRQAHVWQETIIHNKQLWIKNYTQLKLWNFQQKLPLLILINPKSGVGKAREVFQKYMLQLLQDANLLYEVHVTKCKQYAYKLVNNNEDLIRQYSGIVVASGDGLFHEVLNGIMFRKDGHELIQHLPLGIIPCGSGNGLAKSIAHQFEQPFAQTAVQSAMFGCVTGQISSLDVVRLELNDQTLYSFLSVGWGLIADIDIESESLRSFGAHRFTLWTIHRLINLRSNKGRLSYILKKENNEKTNIPALQNPLVYDKSTGWEMEEGEFIMVHAAYTSHLSSDAYFIPDAKLNDGTIYLVVIRAGISRSQLLQSFLALEQGGHIPTQPHKYISLLPVIAFRLEPFCEDGILVVDGERVPYGPIQGEIMPGFLNIMVPPPSTINK